MIHGGTTLPTSFEPRVPVAGNLKIGDLNGKGYPIKLDYIRFCTASATKDGRFPNHPGFDAENASKSKTFTVELISDDPAVNLEIAWVMAGRGSVLCRGNGVEAMRRLTPAGKIDPNANFEPMPEGTCGDKCPFAKQRKCKMASTLRFRIPNRTPLGSVWQFRTTSWNTAQDLLGAMENLKALTGGTLARLPLDFTMTEQRRNPIVDGQRQATNFQTVSLVFNGDESQLLDLLEKSEALKSRYASLGIKSIEDRIREQGPTIGHETEEDALALNLEFFPDSAPEQQQNEDPPLDEHIEWTDDELAGVKAMLDKLYDLLSTYGTPEEEIVDRCNRYLAMRFDTPVEKVTNRVCTAIDAVTVKLEHKP